jgi:hypothetical protein
MENVEFYKYKEFQFEIPYNESCAKITKSDIYIVVNTTNFQNLKICQILSFLWFLEYMYLELKLFTLIEHKIAYI